MKTMLRCASGMIRLEARCLQTSTSLSSPSHQLLKAHRTTPSTCFDMHLFTAKDSLLICLAFASTLTLAASIPFPLCFSRPRVCQSRDVRMRARPIFSSSSTLSRHLPSKGSSFSRRSFSAASHSSACPFLQPSSRLSAPSPSSGARTARIST